MGLGQNNILFTFILSAETHEGPGISLVLLKLAGSVHESCEPFLAKRAIFSYSI
jgi:hypothetical protein